MTSNSPHYLLFSEASRDEQSAPCWRFVLQNVETERRFSVTDTEPTDCGERLELLAVVRGLEALDGPARVTLVTKSRYVSRGIKSGLAEWRLNDWNWERFGRMVPVRDHDLWQRVDRAQRFHQVNCQAWQFDLPAEVDEPQASVGASTAPAEQHVRRSPRRSPRQSRRLAPPLERTRKERISAASSAGEGLIDRVKDKMHRAGHFRTALRALTRSMGHAPGAPA